MNAKEIADNIAFELMGEDEDVLYDTISKDCYDAVADLKNDIEEEVIAILKGHNYNIIY